MLIEFKSHLAQLRKGQWYDFNWLDTCVRKAGNSPYNSFHILQSLTDRPHANWTLETGHDADLLLDGTKIRIEDLESFWKFEKPLEWYRHPPREARLLREPATGGFSQTYRA